MRSKLKKLWQLIHNPAKLKEYARWISRQTKPFLPSLALMTLIDLVLILIGFGSSFLSKTVVDSATAAKPYATAFAIMFTLTAASIGIGAFVNILRTMINERFAFGIRLKLFDRLLASQYLPLSRYHSGDLLTRLTSDANTVATSIATAIPSLAMIFVRLIIAFMLLYSYSPFLALSALLLAPGGLLVSLLTSRKLKEYSIEVKETEAAYRSFLQEHTAHIAVVKTFCMEEHSRTRMSDLRGRTLEALLKRSRLGVLTSTLVRCLFSLGYLLSFSYCLHGLHSGTLSYGTMTLFLTLFSQIQQPLIGLGQLLPQAIAILASADRIMELESIKEDPRSGCTALPSEVSLTFDNVSFAYDRTEILRDISFTATPHQLVGIMGPSGAGKTTLIRLILALAEPTSGNITCCYDGTDEAISADARRMIAYVPQGNTLLSGSIRENLRWGRPDASDEEMFKALEDASADFVHSLPQGLDTPLGEKAMGLSEGQAQRIAIARALLRRAPILILDEATSALDEASEERILSRLSDPKRAYAPLCLIITHRRSMLRYFDRLIEIDKEGHAAFTTPAKPTQ